MKLLDRIASLVRGIGQRNDRKRINAFDSVRWGTEHEVPDVENVVRLIVDPETGAPAPYDPKGEIFRFASGRRSTSSGRIGLSSRPHAAACHVCGRATHFGFCTIEPFQARFLGKAHERWSTCSDPVGVLVPGKTYAVVRVQVCTSHTRFYLAGDGKRHYDSSAFEVVA